MGTERWGKEKQPDLLYEPDGQENHWGGWQKADPSKTKDFGDPRATAGSGGAPPSPTTSASLSGPAPKWSTPPQTQHPDDRRGLAGTSAGQAGGYARPVKSASPEDLLKKANDMLGFQVDQHRELLARGPSTGVRDAAGGQVPKWLSDEYEEVDTD